MASKVSQEGKYFIAKHEGTVLKAYKDAVGVWTIGVGHTSMAGHPKVRPGMVISRAVAMEILENDLVKYTRAVLNNVHVDLNQNQLDALVSFCFNVGEGNLRKSTLLRKLNRGDYQGAANEFHRWNRAGGRVLRGLTRRRAEEKELFLEGFKEETKPKKTTPHPYLIKKGSKGSEVKRLKNLLKSKFNYDIVVNETFGQETDEIVKDFQGKRGLTIDGIVGPATWVELERKLPSVTERLWDKIKSWF